MNISRTFHECNSWIIQGKIMNYSWSSRRGTPPKRKSSLEVFVAVKVQCVLADDQQVGEWEWEIVVNEARFKTASGRRATVIWPLSLKLNLWLFQAFDIVRRKGSEINFRKITDVREFILVRFFDLCPLALLLLNKPLMLFDL